MVLNVFWLIMLSYIDFLNVFIFNITYTFLVD